MAERGSFRSKTSYLWDYALGILVESAYVVSLALVVLVLAWLIFRWF